MRSKLTAKQVIGEKVERSDSKIRSPIPIQKPDWDKIFTELEDNDLILVLVEKTIAHDKKCGLWLKKDREFGKWVEERRKDDENFENFRRYINNKYGRFELSQKSLDRLLKQFQDSWETFREEIVWSFIREHLKNMWKAGRPLTPKEQRASEKRAEKLRRSGRIDLVTRYANVRARQVDLWWQTQLVKETKRLTGRNCLKQVQNIFAIVYKHTNNKRFECTVRSLSQALKRPPLVKPFSGPWSRKLLRSVLP